MRELERTGGSHDEELYRDGWTEETQRSLVLLTKNRMIAYDAESGRYRPAADYSDTSLLDVLGFDENFELEDAFIEELLDGIKLPEVFRQMEELNAHSAEDQARAEEMLADVRERIRQSECAGKPEPALY